MPEKIAALLVHHNSETLTTLKLALERIGVRVTQADSRAQTKHVLSGTNPAPLVFTDAQLPDGTWADVLAIAEKAALPVNVIVVARVVNTRFYVEAIETGAFDFVAPPFDLTDLAYVVRCASDNAVTRRTTRLLAGGHMPEDQLIAEARDSGAEAISA